METEKSQDMQLASWDPGESVELQDPLEGSQIGEISYVGEGQPFFTIYLFN
jgi:hypothetical protein